MANGLDPEAAHTRHFAVLDGMRGLAAVCVVALHFHDLFVIPLPAEHTHLAVDLFFMLSGLVIANAYERKLLTSLSLGQFLAIRAIRLYPMIILGVAVGSIVLLLSVFLNKAIPLPNALMTILSGLVFIPSSFASAFRPWSFCVDNPLWSMSAEIVVNILYAIAIKRLSTPILVALAIIFGIFLVRIGQSHGGLDVGFIWRDYLLSLPRAIAPFIIGVLLWRWTHHRTFTTMWAHIVPLLVFGFLFTPFPNGGLFEPLAVLFLFPLFLVFGMSASRAPGIDGVWTKLGAISYPLYVLHYPIVSAGENAAKMIHARGALALLMLVATALGVAVAAFAALRYYDAPSRRWFSSLITSRDRVGPRQDAAARPNRNAKLILAIYLATAGFVLAEMTFPNTLAGPVLAVMILLVQWCFFRFSGSPPRRHEIASGE